jgi:hypothetical protein
MMQSFIERGDSFRVRCQKKYNETCPLNRFGICSCSVFGFLRSLSMGYAAIVGVGSPVLPFDGIASV